MASIKLKHTSGNGTILNSPAANPSSDITLKLPSTTGSAGQVLSVASANHSSTNAELEFAAAGGISMIDTYNLSSSQSMSGASWNYLKTNFSRVNGAFGTMNVTGLGTGLSVDTSGSASIFSFPSTGYYEITFTATTGANTSSSHDYVYTAIFIARDGSSYDNVVQSISFIYSSSNTVYETQVAKAVIDVTNTSNDKFKLAIQPEQSSLLLGSNDKFYTYVQVKKLAET